MNKIIVFYVMCILGFFISWWNSKEERNKMVNVKLNNFWHVILFFGQHYGEISISGIFLTLGAEIIIIASLISIFALGINVDEVINCCRTVYFLIMCAGCSIEFIIYAIKNDTKKKIGWLVEGIIIGIFVILGITLIIMTI